MNGSDFVEESGAVEPEALFSCGTSVDEEFAEPRISELSAVRLADGKVSVAGRAYPPGVNVHALTPTGEWPSIGTVRPDGTFSNPNLHDGYLADGREMLKVELRYGTPPYPTRETKVSELSAVRLADGKVSVAGRAYPPGVNVHALTPTGEWPSIGTVRPDGTFSNPNLHDGYLADGREMLKVELRYGTPPYPTQETKVIPVYKQGQPGIFPQPRSLTISPLPSAESEAVRVSQRFEWADWQPTGFYLNPQTDLTVNVTGDMGGASLELVIGTPSLVVPWNTAADRGVMFRRLTRGANTVADYSYGGILSLRYVTGDIDQSAPAVTVALGPAAEPMPFFRAGVTTNAQWQAMLDVSTVPLVELTSSRITVTGTLTSARQAQGRDAVALMDAFDRGIEAQNAIAGLDSSTLRNRPSPLRPLFVETRTGVSPNASTYRAVISYPSKGLFEAGSVKDGWVFWHELGHHRQSPTWNWDGSLSEVTVNIYGMAALRLWHEPGAFPGVGVGPGYWDQAVLYLAKPDQEREFDNPDTVPGRIREVMFEQLRVAFGDSFYPNLEKAVRLAEDPGSPAGRKKLFQVEASKAARKDLSEYFTKWGLRPDRQTLEEIAALNLSQPDTDPTTRPVFKGSSAGRVLGGVAFWTGDRKVHVIGHAWPRSGIVQTQHAWAGWRDIATADEHLVFENDHLTTDFLADGQAFLKVRVSGNLIDTREIKVVDRPGVSQLSAVRMPDGKIWVTGRGTPKGVGAQIAVNPSYGSWPHFAEIRSDGTFENDHLRDDWLYRPDTLRARIEYEDRDYGPYDFPVVDFPGVEKPLIDSATWVRRDTVSHVEGSGFPGAKLKVKFRLVTVDEMERELDDPVKPDGHISLDIANNYGYVQLAICQFATEWSDYSPYVTVVAPTSNAA
ncbi:M60 family metallopeptidase [Streptomyces sp. NPDC090442]|uniref:M60 family metallopeptidase n=1 Tax=Streptomyces sp. NPDC090442 TaxID=3365962 RepID=UPI003823217A